MQILGISEFDKTSVNELLTEIQVYQNFKEQYDLLNDQILKHQQYTAFFIDFAYFLQ